MLYPGRFILVESVDVRLQAYNANQPKNHTPYFVTPSTKFEFHHLS